MWQVQALVCYCPVMICYVLSRFTGFLTRLECENCARTAQAHLLWIKSESATYCY